MEQQPNSIETFGWIEGIDVNYASNSDLIGPLLDEVSPPQIEDKPISYASKMRTDMQQPINDSFKDYEFLDPYDPDYIGDMGDNNYQQANHQDNEFGFSYKSAEPETCGFAASQPADVSSSGFLSSDSDVPNELLLNDDRQQIISSGQVIPSPNPVTASPTFLVKNMTNGKPIILNFKRPISNANTMPISIEVLGGAATITSQQQKSNTQIVLNKQATLNNLLIPIAKPVQLMKSASAGLPTQFNGMRFCSIAPKFTIHPTVVDSSTIASSSSQNRCAPLEDGPMSEKRAKKGPPRKGEPGYLEYRAKNTAQCTVSRQKRKDREEKNEKQNDALKISFCQIIEKYSKTQQNIDVRFDDMETKLKALPNFEQTEFQEQKTKCLEELKALKEYVSLKFTELIQHGKDALDEKAGTSA